MKSKLKKEKVACFQHKMAQDIHCHSKTEGKEDSEEILDQSKTKTSLENSKLCISMSVARRGCLFILATWLA